MIQKNLVYGKTKIDDHVIHYCETGGGIPVVFLHGNSGFLQDFTLTLFPLLPHGWRSIAFDRPGYGKSNTSQGSSSIIGQAVVFNSCFKKLGLDRPVLVGHSWSGALILAYALLFPEDLSGIVHLSGVAFSKKENFLWRKFYSTRIWAALNVFILMFPIIGKILIKRSIIEAFKPDHPPEEYVKLACKIWPKPTQIVAAIRELAMLNTEVEQFQNKYNKIKVPAAIIVGEKDSLVPKDIHGIPLSRILKNSSLIVLENAGHDIHVSRTKDVISAIEWVIRNRIN